MPQSHPQGPTDPSAFLAWENRRRGRYELVGGEIRAMAGGTRAHDLVCGNILVALRLALRGRGCDVHGSRLKVVSPSGLVTYPDVFVRCGPLADTATECDDPVLIVEVLAPSTRGEDLVRKRHGYQAIPSLRHLAYVYPDRVEIELATREADGSWRSVFVREGAGIVLSALGIELGIKDVYEGIVMAAFEAPMPESNF